MEQDRFFVCQGTVMMGGNGCKHRECYRLLEWQTTTWFTWEERLLQYTQVNETSRILRYYNHTKVKKIWSEPRTSELSSFD